MARAPPAGPTCRANRFPAYLGYFIVAFVADWMPALGARSAFNNAMLVIPVAALVCAFAGIGLSLRRLWCRRETALDIVVIAGAVALAVTFAIHVGYSYGRTSQTGWLMDAYPRYYLPLAAIVPLAGFVAAGCDRDAAPARRAARLPGRRPDRVPHFGAPLG
jgi:hypothetical protein